jgi:serine/threonine protein kinase
LPSSHGLEKADGIRALVMELVEGDDLSQRIARGAIPIDEALPIANQITDALEAAHEHQAIEAESSILAPDTPWSRRTQSVANRGPRNTAGARAIGSRWSGPWCSPDEFHGRVR